MNILDLDPQSFEVYLAESNPSPEQRKFLLDEYQKRRSPFAPAFEAVQQAEQELVDEGRRRLNLVPASVPQDMNLIEALRAGEADFAAPGMFMGAGESLMTATDMPYATLTGPTSPETMEQAATELSEYLMLGAAPGVARAAVDGVDPTTTRMFVGKETKNPEAKKALTRAEELFADGQDPESIWRMTSEEFPDTPASVLPDGTPFYEISDENVLTRTLIKDEVTDPDAQAYYESQIQPGGTDYQPLSEIMLADELYADVPGIESLKTQLEGRGGLLGNYYGMYYPGDPPLVPPKVQVAERLKDQPNQQAKTLLHEVQHGVQAETGLPGGTNPSFTGELITQALMPEMTAQTRLNTYDKLIPRLQKDLNAPDELVLPFLQKLDKKALELADAKQKAQLRITNAAKQPKTGQYGGARGLYTRDPGEALARLTGDRRRMTMEQRRAKSPMRQLEGGISDLLAWENLAKVKTGQDVRKLFDIPDTKIDGVEASYYVEAVDNFRVNQLPYIIQETVEELKSVTSPEQRTKVIEAGQKRIDKVFNKALTSYK